jgi:hypothetical protein
VTSYSRRFWVDGRAIEAWGVLLKRASSIRKVPRHYPASGVAVSVPLPCSYVESLNPQLRVALHDLHTTLRLAATIPGAVPVVLIL